MFHAKHTYAHRSIKFSYSYIIFYLCVHSYKLRMENFMERHAYVGFVCNVINLFYYSYAMYDYTYKFVWYYEFM